MPGLPERVAALESRCVERGKVITKLDTSVDNLEKTIAKLNGTLRLTLFKVHIIWLGAAAILNVATILIVTRILNKA